MKKTWQWMVVTATASAFLLTRTPIALAIDPSQDNSNYSFPLNTRATLWGTAGNEPWTQGDFMFPLWGNDNSFLFTDATGKYGNDHAWLGSMGLGMRSLVNDKIWGGYLFGDQDVLGDNSHFFVLNPGLELITLNWDARLNGYFPVGPKTQFGGTAWGDQIGVATFVRFQGHTEFDHLFSLTDSVGNGGDIEIGRTLQSLNQTRVYLGGYVTSPKEINSIQGIQGGIQIPLLHRWVNLELADSYDNQQHNTAIASLRFSFGDIPPSSPPEVHDRILEVIPRHLGTLETGTGILHGKNWTDITSNTGTSPGTEPIERTHIFFFDGTPEASSGTIGPESCTFEHPCPSTEFTQTGVDEIKAIFSDASLYFSPGTFNSFDGDITIPNGLTLFGRTSDFALPATPGDYPHFYGGFKINDNVTLEYMTIDGNGTADDHHGVGITDPGSAVSDVILSHLLVENFTLQPPPSLSNQVGAPVASAYGIKLENSSNTQIDHVRVTTIAGANYNGVSGPAPGPAGSGGYATGIDLNGSSNASLSNVTVYNIRSGNAEGGSYIGPRNSLIRSWQNIKNGVGGNGGTGGKAYGINLTGATHPHLNSIYVSQIYGGSAIGGDDPYHAGLGGAGGDAFGINLKNASDITLSSTNIHDIRGGSGNGGDSTSTTTQAYGGHGGSGGYAFGINMQGSTGVNTLSNGLVYNIFGGDANGGMATSSGNHAFGGDGGLLGGGACALNLSGATGTTVSNFALYTINSGESFGGYAHAAGIYNATGGNGGTAGKSVGINLSNANNNHFENVSISNNFAGSANGAAADSQGGNANAGTGGSGGDGIGLLLTGSASGNTFSNIDVRFIHAGAANGGDAYSATGNANGGNGGNGGSAYGILGKASSTYGGAIAVSYLFAGTATGGAAAGSGTNTPGVSGTAGNAYDYHS